MSKTFAVVSAAALAMAAMPAAAQDWSGFHFGGYAGHQMLGGEENETLRFDNNLDGTFGDTVRTGPGTAPTTNSFLIVNPLGTDQRRSSDGFESRSFRVTAAVRF